MKKSGEQGEDEGGERELHHVAMIKEKGRKDSN